HPPQARTPSPHLPSRLSARGRCPDLGGRPLDRLPSSKPSAGSTERPDRTEALLSPIARSSSPTRTREKRATFPPERSRTPSHRVLRPALRGTRETGCPGRDSTPHPFRRPPLKMVCLPVPPPGLERGRSTYQGAPTVSSPPVTSHTASGTRRLSVARGATASARAAATPAPRTRTIAGGTPNHRPAIPAPHAPPPHTTTGPPPTLR